MSFLTSDERQNKNSNTSLECVVSFETLIHRGKGVQSLALSPNIA